MKKISLLFILVLVYPSLGFSQDSVSVSLARDINAGDLKNIINVLSSDSLEGRETGTPGQKKAAMFISDYFNDLGIQPTGNDEKGQSYLQSFSIEKRAMIDGFIASKSKKCILNRDFILSSRGDGPLQRNNVELVFIGNGDSSDYRGLDVKNKAVMLYFDPDKIYGKIRYGRKKGAIDFIILYLKDKETFGNWMRSNKSYLNEPTIGFASKQENVTGANRFYLPPDEGEKLFGVKPGQFTKWMKKNKGRGNNPYSRISPVRINYNLVRKVEVITTENVVGLIRGTKYPGEVIVISSHYDHLGMEGEIIFHGADDNASGTSAVMELAKIFNEAVKKGSGPARSILFLAFTGEEKGLLGSEFYSDNPLFAPDSTIADFNIDMIGRTDQKHNGNSKYIYLIGSDRISHDLHGISEKCNSLYTNLDLDYTYNDLNDPNRFYYRSDHYNFAKKDIPVIFYFSGVHPDYHRPTDTADKIDFNKMTDIIRLIFHTAWEVSNRDEKLKKD
jgi:hypothetical protein